MVNTTGELIGVMEFDLDPVTPGLITASIVTQMQRIRTALERVKNINRYLTNVTSGADSIKDEADGLREEIRDALLNIEDAMRTRAARSQQVDAA